MAYRKVAMASSVPALMLLMLAFAGMVVSFTPWVDFMVTIVLFLYAGWRAVSRYGLDILGAGLSGAFAALLFRLLLVVCMQVIFTVDFHFMGNSMFAIPGVEASGPAMFKVTDGFLHATLNNMLSGFVFAAIFGCAALAEKKRKAESVVM